MPPDQATLEDMEQIIEAAPKDQPFPNQMRKVARAAAEPMVIEGVDLRNDGVDYTYTYRFHETVPGASTNLKGDLAEADNTIPLAMSRHNEFLSPRTPPKPDKNGVLVRENYSYTPRLVEGIGLAAHRKGRPARAALGGLTKYIRRRKSHEDSAHPLDTPKIFSVNLDRHKDLVQETALLKLDGEIKQETEARIAAVKTVRGTPKLPREEQEGFEKMIRRKHLRKYIGEDTLSGHADNATQHIRKFMERQGTIDEYELKKLRREASEQFITKIDSYRRAASERKALADERIRAAKLLEEMQTRTHRTKVSRAKETRSTEQLDEEGAYRAAIALLAGGLKKTGTAYTRLSPNALVVALKDKGADENTAHLIHKRLRDNGYIAQEWDKEKGFEVLKSQEEFEQLLEQLTDTD
jgi:hypothetical protein